MALRQLGADPTAVSPSADIATTATSGLLQVVLDPRTTIDDDLHALLVAELVDTEGWELLIELAEQLDLVDMKTNFQDALLAEEEHLIRIRMFHSNLMTGDDFKASESSA